MEHSVLQFLSIASCPITKHPWKKSGCPFALFYTLTRPLLSLLFSRLNSPSSLNLSSWVRCSIINLEELHCSFQRLSYTEELRNGHRTPHVASAVVTEGRDDIPQPGGYTFFTKRAHCQLMFKLFTRTFSESCFLVVPLLSCVVAWGCSSLGAGLYASPCGTSWGVYKYLGLRWL